MAVSSQDQPTRLRPSQTQKAATMDPWRPLVADQRSAPDRPGSCLSHAHSCVSLRTWKILFSPFRPQTERRVLKGGGDHRAEECRGRVWTGPGDSRDQDKKARLTRLSHLTFSRSLPRKASPELSRCLGGLEVP